MPRAFVRVADPGRDDAGVFADDRGRFELTVPSAACRIVASLAGFEPAEASCAAEPLRLELRVGPIRESVIVTATRTEAPASQVGVSATVFTADDLERRQVPFVADLVGTTPGAMMIRSGAPGTLTSLFVRGGESDYNKVLLDGIPLNEPGGTFYLNNLTTENLERIEIVRGAYSSLFGSDAMASVIQLFTRRADGAGRRPRGSVQIDGGTYGTVHANASVAGATSRVDYSGGVAQYSSDHRVAEQRSRQHDAQRQPGLPGWIRGDPPGDQPRGARERRHARDDGLWTARPRRLLRSERRRRQRGVRPFSRRRAASSARSTRRRTPSRHRPTSSLTRPTRRRSRDRPPPGQSSDFLGDTQADLRRHHASYQADLQVAASPSYGDHRLTLMADWDGERATQENRLADTTTSNSRDNFGIAAQHQMLWPKVFATVGARVEHNENFGTDLAPRATVVVVARTSSGAIGETRLRASAGTGIKEPTMLESYSISPFFLGNLDLSPERSRSVEVGVDQRLAGDRAKVEVAWFDNRFSDIISLRTDPATFEAQYFNVGETRARGLEFGVQAVPIPAVRARASYTLLDSEIVETTSPGNVLFAPGQWAFRRPRNSGSVGATFDWRRVTADINGTFIGRFVDSDFGLFNPPLTENPGHSTWETRVSVALTQEVSAILSIDNLTNTDYSEPFGYQPLGRLVRVGARFAF